MHSSLHNIKLISVSRTLCMASLNFKESALILSDLLYLLTVKELVISLSLTYFILINEDLESLSYLMIVCLYLSSASTESAKLYITVNVSAISLRLRFLPHNVGLDTEHPRHASHNNNYEQND